MAALGSVGWKGFEKYARLVDQPLARYYFSCTATPDTPFNRLKQVLYKKEFSDSIRGPSDEPTQRPVAHDEHGPDEQQPLHFRS